MSLSPCPQLWLFAPSPPAWAPSRFRGPKEKIVFSLRRRSRRNEKYFLFVLFASSEAGLGTSPPRPQKAKKAKLLDHRGGIDAIRQHRKGCRPYLTPEQWAQVRIRAAEGGLSESARGPGMGGADLPGSLHPVGHSLLVSAPAYCSKGPSPDGGQGRPGGAGGLEKGGLEVALKAAVEPGGGGV